MDQRTSTEDGMTTLRDLETYLKKEFWMGLEKAPLLDISSTEN